MAIISAEAHICGSPSEHERGIVSRCETLSQARVHAKGAPDLIMATVLLEKRVASNRCGRVWLGTIRPTHDVPNLLNNLSDNINHESSN